MPASNGFPGVGAVGASHVSPPVQVAIVAGTKTRLRVLEKLWLSLASWSAAPQDATSAEALVVSAEPNAVLLDLDLWSGGLDTIERIMATRATSMLSLAPPLNTLKPPSLLERSMSSARLTSHPDHPSTPTSSCAI